MHSIRPLGAYGGTLVTTVTAQTGTWMAITCMSGTVFATLTELGVTRSGTIGSVLFPVGVTIFGAFTNFTLSSGSVRAYNSTPTSA